MLERLGVIDAMERAGAVRNGLQVWTRVAFGSERVDVLSRRCHGLRIIERRRSRIQPVGRAPEDLAGVGPGDNALVLARRLAQDQRGPAQGDRWCRRNRQPLEIAVADAVRGILLDEPQHLGRCDQDATVVRPGGVKTTPLLLRGPAGKSGILIS